MAREPYFPSWAGRAERELFHGVRMATITGEKLMLMRVTFAPHAMVPEHQHPHEQCGFVQRGEAEFVVGGESRTLAPGDYYVIPGGTPHRVVAGPSGVECLDIFSPPRDEYR
jgi:quercetin dioxygenase-like cupin family protein